MKRITIDRTLLVLAVLAFFLMSVSFAFMPIAGIGWIPGVLFWGGFLSGIILVVLLEVRRRAFFIACKEDYKRLQKPRNGLLSFGSNLPAIVADCLLAVGVLATVLAFVLTEGTGLACYSCISVTLFSFCMHCILNGRIYVYSKNRDKIRRLLEQKIVKKEGEKGI